MSSEIAAILLTCRFEMLTEPYEPRPVADAPYAAGRELLPGPVFPAGLR